MADIKPTIYDFNPRSHEGSDPYQQAENLQSTVFQSTLPRGERHDGKFEYVFLKISIHAPTRGATKNCPPHGGCFFISIHAPTRGATISPLPLLLLE